MSIEEQELQELQRQAQRAPSGSSDPAADMLLDAPYTGEGIQEYTGMNPEGYYLCRLTGMTPKISAVKTDPMSGEQKGNERYINCQWTIGHGERKNVNIFDIVMLEGRGSTRFHILASALRKWDKVAKRYTGGTLKALMGSWVWIKIIHKNEKDRDGNPQLRERVDFAGYEDVSAHPIPPELQHIFSGQGPAQSSPPPQQQSPQPPAVQNAPQASTPPQTASVTTPPVMAPW